MNLDEMTDAEIKEAVRKRDGYRCRDCGMTQDEHIAATGKALDVHRLFPGFGYTIYWCVTLCRSCHGSKPKRLGQLVSGDEFGPPENPYPLGVVGLFLNAYDAECREMLDKIRLLVEMDGLPLEAIAMRVIRAGLASAVTTPPRPPRLLDFELDNVVA